jgi:hypothetical protein
MTADEVLKLAQSWGVALWAGSSGQLRWQCSGPLPADLRDLLVEHKPALLALLPPPWDQKEADRLLVGARAAVANAEAEHRAGRIPAARRNMAQIWLEVAEGLAANHEQEAGRGWDVMPLLRAATKRLSEFRAAVETISLRGS